MTIKLTKNCFSLAVLTLSLLPTLPSLAAGVSLVTVSTTGQATGGLSVSATILSRHLSNLNRYAF
jgi:hypothetical protein